MLVLLAAFLIDAEQAGDPDLAAERLNAQFFFTGFGEKHDVERLQLAKTAGSLGLFDQQVEVGGVQLQLACSRHIAVDVAVRHALGLRYGGVVGDVDVWGTRKLAYPIEKKNEGYYVVMQFQAETDMPKELDRRLKISDNVMRHIIINKDAK